MKFKGDFKKIRFFATIGLSAMAMVVATIGTFAWFQARSSGADPRHTVEAGSSNLTIGDTSVYRYRYNDLGSGAYDYEHGTVSTYTTKSSKPNYHEDANFESIQFDDPPDGVGYYLIGDGNIAVDMGQTSEQGWTYAASTKMTTNSTDIGEGYTCGLFKVYLESGWKFGIRHHTYTNQSETSDTYVTFSTATGATRTTNGAGVSNQGAYVASTGYYDIKLNSSNELEVSATAGSGSGVLKRNRANPGDGPTRKEANVSNDSDSRVLLRVFAHQNSYFSDAGATLKVRIGKNDNSSWSSFYFGTQSDWLTTSSSAYWDVVQINGTGTTYWYCEIDIQDRRSWLDSNDNCIEVYRLNPSGLGQWGYQRILGGQSWVNNICTYGGNSANSVYLQQNNDGNFNGTNKGFVYKIRTMHKASFGGSYEQKTCVVYDNAHYYTLPTPTIPSGYTFDGWYFDEACTTPITSKTSNYKSGGDYGTWKPDSDVQLYAKYSVVSPTITLSDGSGASGGAGSVVATYGEAMPRVKIPKKSGYAFMGYFTGASGAGTQYYTSSGTSATNAAFTANTTLYAHWVSVGTTKTIHVMIDNLGWAGQDKYVYIFSGGTKYYERLDDGGHTDTNYANMYQFPMPTSSGWGFIIFANTSPAFNTSDYTKQTRDMVYSDSYYDKLGKSNSALGTYDMITVQSWTEVYSDKTVSVCHWSNYQSTKPAKGYYFVGGTAYQDAASWSFASGTKMIHERTKSNAAELYHQDLTAGKYYQIWGFDGSNWYKYAAAADGSAATNSYSDIYFSAGGVCNIYLNSENRVYFGTAVNVSLVFSRYNESNVTTTFEMHEGDGSTNRYVRESAIAVKKGDIFTISYKNGTENPTTYLQNIAPEFISASNKKSENEDLYSTFTFLVSGSFTFYWTAGSPNSLSVATVPTTGFGYYILKNQNTSASPTFSYGNCIKMKTIDVRTSGQNKASYYSFYAAAGEAIAFRSYVDFVDKYYDNTAIYYNNNLIDSDTTKAVYKQPTGSTSAQGHGIVIKTAGYYNFFITGSNDIYITKPSSSDFFKVNSIDDGDASSGADIKAQNTALVIQVDFTTNNPYATNLYVDVHSSYALRANAFFLANPGTTSLDIYANALSYAYGTANSNWQTCSTARTAVSAGAMAAENVSTSHTVFIVLDYVPSAIVTASGVTMTLRVAQA